MRIIRTADLKNPRFGMTNPDTFCKIWPWSIENGETHLYSQKTKPEAEALAKRLIAQHDQSLKIGLCEPDQNESVFNRLLPDGTRRPIIEFFNNAAS